MIVLLPKWHLSNLSKIFCNKVSVIIQYPFSQFHDMVREVSSSLSSLAHSKKWFVRQNIATCLWGIMSKEVNHLFMLPIRALLMPSDIKDGKHLIRRSNACPQVIKGILCIQNAFIICPLELFSCLPIHGCVMGMCFDGTTNK